MTDHESGEGPALCLGTNTTLNEVERALQHTRRRARALLSVRTAENVFALAVEFVATEGWLALFTALFVSPMFAGWADSLDASGNIRGPFFFMSVFAVILAYGIAFGSVYGLRFRLCAEGRLRYWPDGKRRALSANWPKARTLLKLPPVPYPATRILVLVLALGTAVAISAVAVSCTAQRTPLLLASGWATAAALWAVLHWCHTAWREGLVDAYRAEKKRRLAERNKYYAADAAVRDGHYSHRSWDYDAIYGPCSSCSEDEGGEQ